MTTSSSPRSTRAPAVVIVGLALVSAWAVHATEQAASDEPLAFRQAMLAAEDARAADPAGLATLLVGVGSPDEEIRRIALRAIGRLERSDLSERIAASLEADAPAVRAEAANALGQSLQRDGDPSAFVAALLVRLERERDSTVRGTVAETLGRLPYQDAETVRRVDRALAILAVSTDPVVRLGAVGGLEVLGRLQREHGALADGTLARLTAAALASGAPGTGGANEANETAARTRRLALSALIGAEAVTSTIVDAVLGDPDPQLRRLAASALGTDAEISGREALIARALADDSPMVRLEALGAQPRLAEGADCDPLAAALEDANSHVVLRALDLLGGACAERRSMVGLVAGVAGRLDDSGAWHQPAHALVALAAFDAARASALLPRFGEHSTWQVRMYAARAAAAMGERGAAALDTLAEDPNANVRGAALRGVVALRGHAADGLLLEALSSDDYGLLRTVAGLLAGSPDRRAPTRLLATLERLTAADRDTSRDPRVAIVTRLGELGSRRNAGVLRSYLEDFDPRVAAAAAEALSAWTGRPVTARTTRLRTGPTPSLAGALGQSAVRVLMANGTEFELELFPEEAPATVERFAGLARSGHYDGLTFHRVAPNFVIQGGSPGANEFMGDGPYMRDELGLRPHLRGTVGISTRGRDTGDAQLFVNLADNPRLDHNYTVFARVTSGMDAVDAVLEGDVIERVEILDR
ncbi:MAG TPA: hypothetical protein DCP38_05760 [Acidobacteria bacterium]|nr:peptidylprolyl isomerase [Vicinamibacterales bacterium]HAK54975.1 hypothetical protein [Acidobacteriota bacterium]